MERREGARGLAKPSLAGLAKPAARLARRASPLAQGPGAPRALHPSSWRSLRKLDCAARIVGAPDRFACRTRHERALGEPDNVEYNPILSHVNEGLRAMRGYLAGFAKGRQRRRIAYNAVIHYCTATPVRPASQFE